MRAAISAVLVLFLCSASVQARPRHWYTDAKLWLGEAAIIGSLVADGRSTCVGFRHGLVEGSPLDRGTRSCGASIGVLVAAGSVYTALHVESVRLRRDDPSRPWRIAGYTAVPVIACAFHCTGAIHNYNLMGQVNAPR